MGGRLRYGRTVAVWVDDGCGMGGRRLWYGWTVAVWVDDGCGMGGRLWYGRTVVVWADTARRVPTGANTNTIRQIVMAFASSPIGGFFGLIRCLALLSYYFRLFHLAWRVCGIAPCGGGGSSYKKQTLRHSSLFLWVWVAFGWRGDYLLPLRTGASPHRNHRSHENNRASMESWQ